MTPATTLSLFDAEAPPPQIEQHVPREARGKIGAMATALGLGTKAEENVDGARPHFDAYPSDRLLAVPAAPDPSWSPEDVAALTALSERMAAAGDQSVANLWRANLAKPRSRYVDLPGLTRMTEGAERRQAGKAHALVPVEPAVQYTSAAEIAGGTNGAAYPLSVLPPDLANRIVHEVNRRLRLIAQAGFAQRGDVSLATAPLDIVALSTQISCITGAMVRVINQVGHLQSLSRRGQTAHCPMTLSRRIHLVNAALAQLAEDVGGADWTVTTLGLLTPELRAAWAAREAAEPLPAPFPRTLFDWASPPRPLPEALSDADLEQTIQQHVDLQYVEACRSERDRRVGHATDPAFF